MSRFGSTATFIYAPGDAITNATTLVLSQGQMPNYPFETSNVTDRTMYRSRSGRSFAYQNYNLRKYTFNWSMLDEGARGSLKTMYDANPLLTFNSNGTNWGTYRFANNSWEDQEVSFELYDLAFTIEETV